MVNIFTDLYYLTFVQELNKSLSGWQPTILPNSTCCRAAHGPGWTKAQVCPDPPPRFSLP